jgi:hypothetical protein
MTLTLSCKSLMNPQEQPVNLIDVKNNIYTTTCNGLAETIGTCQLKAQKTCAKGYNLIEEKVDSTGVHRAIKFQCR